MSTKVKKAAKTTEKVLTPAELKRQAKMMQALGRNEDDEEGEGEGEDGEGGKIQSILKLYTKGFTRSEIINLGGFNKTTVYRQTGEFNKMKKAPVMNYYGFEMFESRVQRIIKAKRVTRDKAVEMIMQSDLK